MDGALVISCQTGSGQTRLVYNSRHPGHDRKEGRDAEDATAQHARLSASAGTSSAAAV